MRTSALAGWLMVASVLLAGAAPQKTPPKGRTRQIFVGVTDRTGTPVLDLTSGDFEVTEGGVKRTVARAALAAEPMRIAVLVDTSEATNAALNPIRTALDQFFGALPPDSEAMLVTTGRQVQVRVPPTRDHEKLRKASDSLFMDGGATVLMDAVLEIDSRFMRKAPDRWPVFVVLTADGREGSPGQRENEFHRWVMDLPSRDIAIHAVVLKLHGGGIPEIVANNMSENSAGRYEFANTANSAPEKMKKLAFALGDDQRAASETYLLEFATDAEGMPAVDVGVARQGVSVKVMATRLR